MTTLLRLRPLLLAGGSHPLLLSGEQTITADQLRERVLRLAAALATRPGQRWAVWLNTPGEFLITFMALALAGKTLCLPGNMQPATAAAMSRHFDGLVSHTDFTDLACPCITPAQLLEDEVITDTSFTPVIEADIELVMFTSGSTGEPQAIRKSLLLLEQELQVLQQFGGELLGRQPVFSTVSHQHIYGLLHLILWPLVRRAPIVDGIFQYPEEWLTKAASLAPVTLISSPTHLRRLPENNSFQKGHAVIGQIISSGGLLDDETASALISLTGSAPIEILGSTETGGVAWRRQDYQAVWQPLPGVVCQQDPESGCLAVISAHMGDIAGDQTGFVMGDRIALHDDGSFSLLGRADRLLKVEGKRVSATEMETVLAAHEWINQAKVILLAGRREELGAAVELSEAGQSALADQGKLAINRALRDYLFTVFERPVLPRRWRYLSALPVNTQGKVVLAAITGLFAQKDLAS